MNPNVDDAAGRIAFLPGNILMAVCSLGLSAHVVTRYGIRGPLAAGLASAAPGLLLFARAPVDGGFVVDLLPGMLLLGLGAGVAFNPLLLAAMSGVDETESGLASGIVNTSFMMGGALGLAVLASLAAAHTGVDSTGEAARMALNEGYRLAFAVGAAFALPAAMLGWLLPRPRRAGRGNAGDGRDHRGLSASTRRLHRAGGAAMLVTTGLLGATT
jgi:MFS family permease